MIESSVPNVNIFSYSSTDKKNEVKITDVNNTGKKKINLNAKASAAIFITLTVSFAPNSSFNSFAPMADDKSDYSDYCKVNIDTDNYLYLNAQRNDTINMNNNTLEVEDLADMVTQTQIEEIKAHFDTKIQATETILKQEIKSNSSLLEQNLKDFIREENEEIKRTKTGSFRFWIGQILVPMIVTLLTIFSPIIFHRFFK